MLSDPCQLGGCGGQIGTARDWQDWRSSGQVCCGLGLERVTTPQRHVPTV